MADRKARYERLAHRLLNYLENGPVSALVIGVVCQVSVILIVGGGVHWFTRLSEVEVGVSFWSGITVLTVGACLLGPWIMMFRGDR
jgi:hypothetical protein